MKHYPQHYEELQQLMGQLGKEIPSTMQGFSKLYQGTIAEGALSTNEQLELVL